LAGRQLEMLSTYASILRATSRQPPRISPRGLTIDSSCLLDSRSQANNSQIHVADNTAESRSEATSFIFDPLGARWTCVASSTGLNGLIKWKNRFQYRL
jgi:hypothetical protein